MWYACEEFLSRAPICAHYKVERDDMRPYLLLRNTWQVNSIKTSQNTEIIYNKITSKCPMNTSANLWLEDSPIP